MKSVTRLVPIFMFTVLMTGCMCLMPMEHMAMRKDNMGQMGAGDSGSGQVSTVQNRMIAKRAGAFVVAMATIPTQPTVGENVVRVNLTDSSGDTVKDPDLALDVGASMAGMTTVEERAVFIKDSYQATMRFDMAGQWHIIVKIKRLREPEGHAEFTVTVS